MKKIYWFRLFVSVVLALIVASLTKLLGGDLCFGSAKYVLDMTLLQALAAVVLVLAGFSIYFLWCTIVQSDREIRSKKMLFGIFTVVLLLFSVFPMFLCRLDMPLAAVVMIAVTAVATLVLIIMLLKFNRISGYFLIPFLLLVIYLAYLSYQVLTLA